MNAPSKRTSTVLSFSKMSDEELSKILRAHSIGLTVEEARKISRMLGRDPTLVEATIWGIQGSEHSSYKSSRRFLKIFPTTGKHVILGPKEDSGIVAITDGPKGKRWGIVISHESHNHPSQIVPFEGAATGVGGTVRDVVCMGARVIGCMDLLRFGDLKTEETRTIANEVVRGIAGYGNPLGVPNLGGDTVFDSGFNDNCLVNAVAIGLVREDEVIHSFVPEEAAREHYDIILVGKPTDRSGFGGASFASTTMEEEKRDQNTGAVQEPNPFLERHLLASTYALFDWLATEKKLDKGSFKDLGAGGVVCSSVEQVAEKGFGAEIDLENVHVSIENLPPEVIACAETQERFCWMCHPSLTEHILHHYNVDWDLPRIAERAGACVIGTVTGDGMYRLRYRGELVCDARAIDIVSGLQYIRQTVNPDRERSEPHIACNGSQIIAHSPLPSPFKIAIDEVFKAMLLHPSLTSKAPIIRHYDKSVIGNTLIEAGEADAGVIAPLQDLESYVHRGTHPGWDLPEDDRWIGVALAGDGNPRYGRISAYWQGVTAAVESMCNVAAVGAIPRALTDCLNEGNPENPEHLGALEQGVKGIADAANGMRFGGEPVPIISGNVSLYNSTPDGGAIPPSAIVCVIGVLPDARKALTQQIKRNDSQIFLLGDPADECGGSAYYEILEMLSGSPRDALLGANLPKPNFERCSAMIRFLSQVIERGFILASHDIGEGGLLMTLFEMLVPQRKIGGVLGMEVALDSLPSALRSDTLLFTQTPGFVLEIAARHSQELLELAEAQDIHLHPIGRTIASPTLSIQRQSHELFRAKLIDLLALWDHGLERALSP
ncbi:phosphoribosylformylglycinamidine synthase subunit PurL [Candidatus Peregrinibacteria bacterium]|nr:phosphoribosylformylglycinamidine synthase subunit PurL [Candidatus Peregrinibacteria bacterium]MBI3816817.1 phosphoribosylformylglycinamidine synthase subunit PurL [Candidatus Peregrinibacteria bacterium]